MRPNSRTFRPTVSEATSQLENREVLTTFAPWQLSQAAVSQALHARATLLRSAVPTTISMPSTSTQVVANTHTNRTVVTPALATAPGPISHFWPTERREYVVTDSSGRQFRLALG